MCSKCRCEANTRDTLEISEQRKSKHHKCQLALVEGAVGLLAELVQNPSLVRADLAPPDEAD